MSLAAPSTDATARADETTPSPDETFNEEMASRFDLAAGLLEVQHADEVRVHAYRRAADTLRQLDEPASQIYRTGGAAALVEVPTIGRVLARAIADVVETGHWRWLERLQGEVDPERVLSTVAGIGTELAGRVHEQLGVESLEELEIAAHDGRLATVGGFGPKRITSVRDSLAGRLHTRSETHFGGHEPTIAELLSIDVEYRSKAEQRLLPTIRPRRFNPDGERRIPILHTTRGGHHYTALYSNTVRAHALERTHDWVVIYADRPDDGQWTVITETTGPHIGERVVRGRAARRAAAGRRGDR